MCPQQGRHPTGVQGRFGARNQRHHNDLRRLLARASLIPTEILAYDEAAALYRVCRRSGETVRKLIGHNTGLLVRPERPKVPDSGRDNDRKHEVDSVRYDRPGTLRRKQANIAVHTTTSCPPERRRPLGSGGGVEAHQTVQVPAHDLGDIIGRERVQLVHEAEGVGHALGVRVVGSEQHPVGA